jgi:hypothetical protein
MIIDEKIKRPKPFQNPSLKISSKSLNKINRKVEISKVRTTLQ